MINADPERIYDLISDLPRMGEWSPECERVEWTGGGTTAAVGARFVGHNRGGPPPRVARKGERPISNVHVPAQKAIALQSGDGEALWFMGFLATIKATGEETAGRVAVIHHLGPQDAGSPLHVHHREDEWFYVLDGELTIWVGGQVIRAPAGSFVFGPQGTPHTFTVSSAGGASFLLVTEPGGFEAFMRTCAEPARSLTLPPPPSSPPDPAQLAALAAGYGIDILGPPGIPAQQH